MRDDSGVLFGRFRSVSGYPVQASFMLPATFRSPPPNPGESEDSSGHDYLEPPPLIELQALKVEPPGRGGRRNAPARSNADKIFDAVENSLRWALIVALTLAALVATLIGSQFYAWLMPVALIIAATTLVGIVTKQILRMFAWAAVVAVLATVAMTFDTTLQVLSILNDLLHTWMTYRVLACLALAFLGVRFLIWLGKTLGDRAAIASESGAVPMPALDPRGYGRYAIADFVEKQTYGDADLASKGAFHLALSRKGSENYRFRPKFHE